MIVLRVIVNALILAVEIGLAAGAAWLGLHHPLWFAGLTAALAFLIGLRLEYLRLEHELPFYFDRPPGRGWLLARPVALVEALVKGILAGIVAILTFSGTDANRLYWTAIIFGVAVFVGSSLLRRISISLAARPSRWGYFRLAAPLGLVFSLALIALPSASFSDVGWKLIFDLPAKPSLEQASEVLFLLKQKFDELVALLLSALMPKEWARVVGALASVNVMTGFVIAIYAALAAEVVCILDDTLP